MNQKLFLKALLGASVCTIALSACNVFSPVDHPKGDAQLTSAARACFDQGDFSCALSEYGKLSGNGADINFSESAFAALDQQGVGMSQFLQAIGDGGLGKALTFLANSLAPTASTTKRQSMYTAYLSVNSIQNAALRGLVRFVGALAIASEILAESAGSRGQLLQSEYVNAPASCLITGSTGCLTAGASVCGSGSAALPSITGSATSIITTPAPLGAMDDVANWGQFYAAMQAIVMALDTELEASGRFQSGASAAASAILNIPGASASNMNLNVAACIKQELLSISVGS